MSSARPGAWHTQEQAERPQCVDLEFVPALPSATGRGVRLPFGSGTVVSRLYGTVPISLWYFYKREHFHSQYAHPSFLPYLNLHTHCLIHKAGNALARPLSQIRQSHEHRILSLWCFAPCAGNNIQTPDWGPRDSAPSTAATSQTYPCPPALALWWFPEHCTLCPAAKLSCSPVPRLGLRSPALGTADSSDASGVTVNAVLTETPSHDTLGKGEPARCSRRRHRAHFSRNAGASSSHFV